MIFTLSMDLNGSNSKVISDSLPTSLQSRKTFPYWTKMDIFCISTIRYHFNSLFQICSNGLDIKFALRIVDFTTAIGSFSLHISILFKITLYFALPLSNATPCFHFSYHISLLVLDWIS